MSRIPDRIIEEVRFRTDIVDLISSQTHLKKAGSVWKACCPFHKEKTPSFTVNPDRQSYKCFGCGEGGDVFSFTMKTQGLEFLDAVRFLAGRCGVEIVEEQETGAQAENRKLRDIHAQVAALYERSLSDMPEASGAREYLRSRGLDDKARGSFQIGYAPESWDTLVRWAESKSISLDTMVKGGLLRYKSDAKRYYDAFRGRLMFPIRDSQGRVIAFSARKLLEDDPLGKYVNSPETPIFKKSRVLYAFDLARKHIVAHPKREAIVCEGQIDVIRCHVAGLPRAVAAQGTAFTEEHVELLKRYADSVVLVFDSDAAGRKAAVKTATFFVAAGVTVRVAALPEGEDPDSFIMAQGHRAFEEVLDQAASAVAYTIETARLGEDDPRSVGAVDRVSREVLALIAPCPNAVQSATMMREASELLELPQSALEREMEGVREKERIRQSYTESRSPSPSSRPSGGSGRSAARSPIADPFADAAPADGGWHPGMFEEPVGGDDAGTDFGTDTSVVDGAPGDPPPRDGNAPLSREETVLCETLVHVADDEEIGHLVGMFLPAEMLTSHVARTIRDAAVRAAAESGDIFEILAESGDEDLVCLGMQLFKAPVRVLGEFSHAEAVRDLILCFWRSRILQERNALRARGSALSVAEQQRASQLTIDLKQLARWNTGAHVIEDKLE